MAATNENHGLGVAPLSALDLPHADYIRAAHAAGFGAVGLRLEQVTPSDPPFPRDRRSPGFRKVREALEDTGLEVLDVEVLTIRPGTGPKHWMPLLELGAELGAKFLNVGGENPSLSQFADTVGRLTQDAHTHGLQPVLEPVAFRPLNNFDRAVDIAREAGCAVILDVLHFVRTHTDLTTIAKNADLFPVFQICDAPTEPPRHGNPGDRQGSIPNLVEDMIAEARSQRLVPGDEAGVAPIRELLDILGTATRISVEIPNANLRANRLATDYLRMLHTSVAEYLSESPRRRMSSDTPQGPPER